MICSATCSGSLSRWAVAAVLVASIGAPGCRHGGAAERPTRPAAAPSRAAGAAPQASPPVAPAGGAEARRRILVLPVHNLTGGQAPVKELGAAIERAVARRFEVIPLAEVVEGFLARHRMRYTGGIDAAQARAAREELGADAVLITSLQIYRAANPPALAISMRLVTTENEPTIVWMDHLARAGDESPGLLGLGLISSLKPIQDEMVARLARSLEAKLEGEREPQRCNGGRRYRPRVRFRSSMLDQDEPYTLAVIPFFDRSSRRGAGEAVSLELVRQLVATGRYRVLEPGVVRDFLLQRRIIMPGGVSLEATRLLLGALGVQLVASGTVFDYSESGGAEGPTIRFNLVLLDGGSGEVVWHSTSFNRGDDGVIAFNLGRVATADALTCRMVDGVVDRLTERGGQADREYREDPVRAAIDRRTPNEPAEGMGGVPSPEPDADADRPHEGP